MSRVDLYHSEEHGLLLRHGTTYYRPVQRCFLADARAIADESRPRLGFTSEPRARRYAEIDPRPCVDDQEAIATWDDDQETLTVYVYSDDAAVCRYLGTVGPGEYEPVARGWDWARANTGESVCPADGVEVGHG